MSAVAVQSFHDQVLADCEELRELAAWFEGRSKADTHGKWLRGLAMRYETISGAYNTASRRVIEQKDDQDSLLSVARAACSQLEFYESQGPVDPESGFARDMANLRAALARVGGAA